MPIKVDPGKPWTKTETYLKRLQKQDLFSSLEKYGQMGVSALESATPNDSGETAQSWTYEIVQRRGYFAIHWYNTHRENGNQIVILLQYGHATGTGGYVQGRDYIMPAIKPIFDQIDAEMRKVVTR